jgi:hypothetical protein
VTYTNPITRLAAALAGVACIAVVVAHGASPDIVRKAAGIGSNAQGLERFISATDSLVTPAVIALAALAPLACLVGAGALMFGNRRGLIIIAAALGTLVFVASLKGIVA